MRPLPLCSRSPQRQLKNSTVLTTNLGIESCGMIFDDPIVAAAMLDRLLHRSGVFNIGGDCYRRRTHRGRAEPLSNWPCAITLGCEPRILVV